MTTTYAYDSSRHHDPSVHGWLAHHDAAALDYMAAQLHRFVQDAVTRADSLPVVFLPEPDGRQHRVVLVNAEALRSKGELTFVAFFGYKRPEIDAKILDELDQELIQEFIGYPHLLSYSSLELSDGSWANLVLMSSPAGIAHWAESQRHAYAAREIAPKCYRSIRLHRGVLRTGIALESDVEFRRTKLFAWNQNEQAKQ